MPKVFPPTVRFDFHTSMVADPSTHVATAYIAKGDFEDMMRNVASHALLHAKLRGHRIAAFMAPTDRFALTVLNAYPQGHTEVYR